MPRKKFKPRSGSDKARREPMSATTSDPPKLKISRQFKKTSSSIRNKTRGLGISLNSRYR